MILFTSQNGICEFSKKKMHEPLELTANITLLLRPLPH